MKRVYSFIVMCFTIMILVVASLPSIKSNKTLSTQFSKGTELVYKIESWEEGKEVTDAQIERTVDVINERIETSGLGLYEVSYIGNDYVRILCPETDYSKIEYISNIIININIFIITITNCVQSVSNLDQPGSLDLVSTLEVHSNNI